MTESVQARRRLDWRRLSRQTIAAGIALDQEDLIHTLFAPGLHLTCTIFTEPLADHHGGPEGRQGRRPGPAQGGLRRLGRDAGLRRARRPLRPLRGVSGTPALLPSL